MCGLIYSISIMQYIEPADGRRRQSELRYHRRGSRIVSITRTVCSSAIPETKLIYPVFALFFVHQMTLLRPWRTMDAWLLLLLHLGWNIKLELQAVNPGRTIIRFLFKCECDSVTVASYYIISWLEPLYSLLATRPTNQSIIRHARISITLTEIRKVKDVVKYELQINLIQVARLKLSHAEGATRT